MKIFYFFFILFNLYFIFNILLFILFYSILFNLVFIWFSKIYNKNKNIDIYIKNILLLK